MGARSMSVPPPVFLSRPFVSGQFVSTPELSLCRALRGLAHSSDLVLDPPSTLVLPPLFPPSLLPSPLPSLPPLFPFLHAVTAAVLRQRSTVTS